MTPVAPFRSGPDLGRYASKIRPRTDAALHPFLADRSPRRRDRTRTALRATATRCARKATPGRRAWELHLRGDVGGAAGLRGKGARGAQADRAHAGGALAGAGECRDGDLQPAGAAAHPLGEVDAEGLRELARAARAGKR